MNISVATTATQAHERLGRHEPNIGEYVREEPLTALAIAGGVGFILGGGVNGRIGFTLLTVAGRIALRGAATSFIMALVTYSRRDQGPDRAEARGKNHCNGNYDNRRTDFRDPD